MIEVKRKGVKESVKGFPKLMNHKYSKSLIVLMTTDSIGIVVSNDKNISRIGEYANDWETFNFEDYNEELTIKNK